MMYYSMKQRASTLWSMDGCATEIVYRTDADRPLPDVSTK